MTHTYRLRKDTICDEKGGAHTVYGIECLDPDGHVLRAFPDLFFDEQKAIHFIHLCNQGELSPAHFSDIADDILNKQYIL